NKSEKKKREEPVLKENPILVQEKSKELGALTEQFKKVSRKEFDYVFCISTQVPNGNIVMSRRLVTANLRGELFNSQQDLESWKEKLISVRKENDTRNDDTRNALYNHIVQFAQANPEIRFKLLKKQDNDFQEIIVFNLISTSGTIP